jgi:hypothetical protein
MSRRCCCERPCLIVEDDFNRGDNTDLGAKWNEISGDWQISGNTLTEAGTANALVINNTSNPSSGRGVVSINIYPVDGAKYRVVLNYLNPTDYQWVEAYCTTASLVLTAGSETRTYAAADGWDITNPDSDLAIKAIVDNGLLYIQVTQLGFQGAVWDNTVTLGTGRKAGLMNGAATVLTFDGFFYYQHYLDNSNCPDLVCWCTKSDGSRHYIAWKLQIDYYSDDAPPCPTTCECFNGGQGVLEWDASAEAWIAVSGSNACGAFPISGSDGDRPKIWCGQSIVTNWRLDGPCCCDSDVCTEKPASTLVCDPFSVRWNYTVVAPDLTCVICGEEYTGTYYAIATEV